jgi:hypothetical protein
MKYILLSLIIILTSFTFCYGQEHTKGELYRFYKYWQPVNSKTDSVTFIKDTARYYTTMNGKPFIYAMMPGICWILTHIEIIIYRLIVFGLIRIAPILFSGIIKIKK